MAPAFPIILLWIIFKSVDICKAESAFYSDLEKSSGGAAAASSAWPRSGGSAQDSPTAAFLTSNSDRAWATYPEDRVVTHRDTFLWRCPAPPRSVSLASGSGLHVDAKWTYAWFKDGVELTDWDIRSLQIDRDTGVLKIGRVRQNNNNPTGSYYCLASSGHYSIQSREALLQLASLGPQFDAVPNSTRVAVGDAVQLSCRIKALPPPTITWYRDNTPLPPFDRYIQLSSGDLLIAGVRETDSGLYNCSARNEDEQITSPAAQLTVTNRGDGMVQEVFVLPEDASVRPGESFTFACAITSRPLPQARFQLPECSADMRRPVSLWRCEDEGPMQLACPAGSAIRIIDANFGRTRPENQVCPSDRSGSSNEAPTDCIDNRVPAEVRARCDGARECVLPDNSSGFYTADWRYSGPTTSTGTVFGSLSTEEVQRRTELCKATTMYLNVTYSCYCKDGARRQAAAQERGLRLSPDGHALYIESASPALAGPYSCYLDNIHVSTAILSVPERPQIVYNGSVEISKHTSMSLHMTCNFTGEPRPEIKWLRNGRELDVSGGGHVVVSEILVERGYQEELYIPHSRLDDTGIYQCVATNAAGSDSMYYTINILQNENAPQKARNLRGRVLSSTSVELHWDAAQSAIPILVYSVHYVPVDRSDAEKQTVTDSNLTSYTVTELHPNTNYSFYLIAYTDNGVGNQSEPITLRTLEHVCLESPPVEVYPRSSAGAVYVTWQPLSNVLARGNVVQWRLDYRPYQSAAGGLSSNFNSMTVSGSDFHARIMGLTPGEKYQVRLVCVTGAGAPTYLSEANFPWKTVHIPDSDASTLKFSPGVRTLNVSWLRGDVVTTGYELSRLQVRYGRKGEGNRTEVEVPVTDTSVLIRGLEPDTHYVVELIVAMVREFGTPLQGQFQNDEWTLPLSATKRLDIPYLLVGITRGPHMKRATAHGNFPSGQVVRGNYTGQPVELQWSSKLTDPRIQYHVEYTPLRKVLGVDYPLTNSTRSLQVPNALNVTVTDLDAYTLYEMRVRAQLNLESSEWSTACKISTAESTPSAPRNLTLQAQSPGVLEVKWESPEFPNGYITAYLFLYRSHENRTAWQNLTLNNTHTRLRLTRLQTTTYDLRLCATTRVGVGECTTLIALADTVLSEPGIHGADPRLGSVMLALVLLVILACVVCIIVCLCFVFKARTKPSSTHGRFCKKCKKKCGIAQHFPNGSSSSSQFVVPSRHLPASHVTAALLEPGPPATRPAFTTSEHHNGSLATPQLTLSNGSLGTPPDRTKCIGSDGQCCCGGSRRRPVTHAAGGCVAPHLATMPLSGGGPHACCHQPLLLEMNCSGGGGGSLGRTPRPIHQHLDSKGRSPSAARTLTSNGEARRLLATESDEEETEFGPSALASKIAEDRCHMATSESNVTADTVVSGSGNEASSPHRPAPPHCAHSDRSHAGHTRQFDPDEIENSESDAQSEAEFRCECEHPLTSSTPRRATGQHGDEDSDCPEGAGPLPVSPLGSGGGSHPHFCVDYHSGSGRSQNPSLHTHSQRAPISHACFRPIQADNSSSFSANQPAVVSPLAVHNTLRTRLGGESPVEDHPLDSAYDSPPPTSISAPPPVRYESGQSPLPSPPPSPPRSPQPSLDGDLSNNTTNSSSDNRVMSSGLPHSRPGSVGHGGASLSTQQQQQQQNHLSRNLSPHTAHALQASPLSPPTSGESSPKEQPPGTFVASNSAQCETSPGHAIVNGPLGVLHYTTGNPTITSPETGHKIAPQPALPGHKNGYHKHGLQNGDCSDVIPRSSHFAAKHKLPGKSAEGKTSPSSDLASVQVTNGHVRNADEMRYHYGQSC